jgi:hypothetical protein
MIKLKNFNISWIIPKLIKKKNKIKINVLKEKKKIINKIRYKFDLY